MILIKTKSKDKIINQLINEVNSKEFRNKDVKDLILTIKIAVILSFSTITGFIMMLLWIGGEKW